jgi:ParB-like chromosome segregation protein Spo0J
MTVQLVDRTFSLHELCLDPNNPRYADLGVSKVVPESKVAEESVQATALARMLEDRFEVEQLKESIEKMGFLRVDRMVVVGLPGDGSDPRYMVVEGNRRLAAMKSLMNEVASGEVDLLPEIDASLQAIPVLEITGGASAEREEHARNLQGIRHIAGVKPWGPYQQALAVGRMIEEGLSVATIKSALGLSAQRVNLLRGVFLGMKQMREDPEFTDSVKPEFFSHFVEALNRPQIREWLDWNKEKGCIESETARRQFYQLIVGMENEEGEIQDPKIIDAKDFRLLPQIMGDKPYFDSFLANPTQSLQDAYKSYARPPEPLPDWKSILRRDITTLENNVPHTAIVDAAEDDVALLAELRDICVKFLTDIERVQAE